ncbi:MAG TPA: hypothetical protein VNL71_06410, partial [Chloroflexota bacterium]|nr:hypothetical protein [Chloroflexota bacterium]
RLSRRHSSVHPTSLRLRHRARPDHGLLVTIELAPNVVADIRTQLRQRSAGMTRFVSNELYTGVASCNQDGHRAARGITAEFAAELTGALSLTPSCHAAPDITAAGPATTAPAAGTSARAAPALGSGIFREVGGSSSSGPRRRAPGDPIWTEGTRPGKCHPDGGRLSHRSALFSCL